MLDIPNAKKRIAASVLHYGGLASFQLARMLRLSPTRGSADRDPSLVDFQRILIIRVDHIGDVVMATPLFRELRRRYPNARLTALVGSWAKDVVVHNPHLDEVIVYDAPWWAGIRAGGDAKKTSFLSTYRPLLARLRDARYDLVLDPRGDFRHIALFAYASGAPYRIGYGRSGGDYLLTTVCPWDSNRSNIDKNLEVLRPLGITHPSPETEVYCSEKDVESLRGKLADRGVTWGEPLLTIHPGARTMVKRWPVERFAQVADEMARMHQTRVVIVGGHEEREMGRRLSHGLERPPVQLAGELSLLELIALFRHSSLVLCNDSGPMHLAAACSVPMAAVFGPTDPEVYGYRSAKRDWVYRPLPCSPCHFENSCPIAVDPSVSECLRQTPVELVTELSHALWPAAKPARSGSSDTTPPSAESSPAR